MKAWIRAYLGPEVKKGQTWMFDAGHVNNPFLYNTTDPKTYGATVIALGNGWVLFNTDSKIAVATTIRRFRRFHRLVRQPYKEAK